MSRWTLLPIISNQRIIVKDSIGVAEIGNNEIVVGEVDFAVAIEVAGFGANK